MELIHKLTKILFKKPFYGKSLLGKQELDNLTDALRKTLKIEGNVIECGVYRGGSLTKIVKELRKQKVNKWVFGLDTFKGFPYYDVKEKYLFDKHDFRDNNYTFVKMAMKFHKIHNVILMKENFIDSFKKLRDKSFSFVNLDCDLYQSYVECIEFLLPRLRGGGIMFFHDYNSKTVKRSNEAIEKYFRKDDLVILKPKSAYYVKPKEDGLPLTSKDVGIRPTIL